MQKMIHCNRLYCLQGKNFNILPRIQLCTVANLSEARDADTVFKENKSSVKNLLNKDIIKSVQKGKFVNNQNKVAFIHHSSLKNVYNTIKSSPINVVINVLKHYCLTKERPLEILKLASERIRNDHLKVSLKDLTDLLFCFSQLSYKDKVLIQTLVDKILEKDLTQLTGSLSNSVLFSIGKLKYRNCELIDIIAKNVLNQEENMKKLNGMLATLMTMAVVNAESPYLSALHNKLSSYSKEQFCTTESYLNYVWSSVLTNELSVKHISEVLSPQFTGHLLFLNREIGKRTPIEMKLQNINIAAKTLLPSYNGPLLNKHILYKIFQSNSKAMFFHSVMDSLTNIFEKNLTIQTNIEMGGLLVEIQFLMDKRRNQLLSNNNEGVKVALMLLDFSDFCLGSEHLTGINNFKCRILEGLGYRVVPISYTEYYIDQPLEKKIDFLKKKLESVKN